MFIYMYSKFDCPLLHAFCILTQSFPVLQCLQLLTQTHHHVLPQTCQNTSGMTLAESCL